MIAKYAPESKTSRGQILGHKSLEVTGNGQFALAKAGLEVLRKNKVRLWAVRFSAKRAVEL